MTHDETPDATRFLPVIEPLVGIIAREATAGRPGDYDDVRQEGLIAAWQAATARPDAPREYLVAAARNGIKSLLRGRKAFGAHGRRGLDPSTSSLDALTDSEESAWDAPDDRALTAFDRVEALDEFEDMVRVLPTAYQEIVRLRELDDLEWSEVAQRTGRANGSSVSKTWKTYIQPLLQAAHSERAAA